MYEVFELLLSKFDVTPYRVSKETGISTATLSDWKNGRSTPKQDKLKKIADYFGVSLDYLMSGKEEPEKKEITITTKDERDISKKLNRIMDDLVNDKDGPLYYNGEEIDEMSLSLLADAIESAMRQLKIVNKGKYGRPKNEKKETD